VASAFVGSPLLLVGGSVRGLRSMYLLRRRLVRLLACSVGDLSSDVEVVVLRHQLMASSARQAGGVFAVGIGCSWPRSAECFLELAGRGSWLAPHTLLRWHRELVRQKWTYRRISTGGRPPISEEVHELILRMGRENPRWGCLRTWGELAKLEVRVSAKHGSGARWA
jgi:hypothetical protein